MVQIHIWGWTVRAGGYYWFNHSLFLQLGVTLMRVIETLSESDSGEQREAEKQKLEEQFRQSDQRLDGLVAKHQKDLIQTMQVYGKINNRSVEQQVVSLHILNRPTAFHHGGIIVRILHHVHQAHDVCFSYLYTVSCAWQTHAAFSPNNIIATKILPSRTWRIRCKILTTNLPRLNVLITTVIHFFSDSFQHRLFFKLNWSSFFRGAQWYHS